MDDRTTPRPDRRLRAGRARPQSERADVRAAPRALRAVPRRARALRGHRGALALRASRRPSRRPALRGRISRRGTSRARRTSCRSAAPARCRPRWARSPRRPRSSRSRSGSGRRRSPTTSTAAAARWLDARRPGRRGRIAMQGAERPSRRHAGRRRRARHLDRAAPSGQDVRGLGGRGRDADAGRDFDGGGRATTSSALDPPGAPRTRTVAVTVEADGGVDAPTSPPMMQRRNLAGSRPGRPRIAASCCAADPHGAPPKAAGAGSASSASSPRPGARGAALRLAFTFGLLTALASEIPTLDPARSASRSSATATSTPTTATRCSRCCAARRAASSSSRDEIAPLDEARDRRDRGPRFYEHHGVDMRGIARAVWADVRHQGVVQGGSTITQQFVKNAYVTRRAHVQRGR